MGAIIKILCLLFFVYTTNAQFNDETYDWNDVDSKELRDYSAKEEDEQIAQKLFDDIDVMKQQVNRLSIENDYVDDQYEREVVDTNDQEEKDQIDGDMSIADVEKDDSQTNLNENDQLENADIDSGDSHDEIDRDSAKDEFDKDDQQIKFDEYDQFERNIQHDDVETDDHQVNDQIEKNVSKDEEKYDKIDDFEEDDNDIEDWVDSIINDVMKNSLDEAAKNDETQLEQEKNDESQSHENLNDQIDSPNREDKSESKDDGEKFYLLEVETNQKDNPISNENDENSNNAENVDNLDAVLDSVEDVPLSVHPVLPMPIKDDVEDAGEYNSDEDGLFAMGNSIKEELKDYNKNDVLDNIDYDDIYETIESADDEGIKDADEEIQPDINSHVYGEESEISEAVDEVIKTDDNDSDDTEMLSIVNQQESGENFDDKAQHASIKVDVNGDENIEELSAKMRQFQANHFDELDTSSDTFNRDVPAVEMELKVEEVVEIQSPNYPEPYVGENTVDWVLRGNEGMGVELNFTDLAINDGNGDYLLVKPGGLDETDNDGLLFTGELKYPRNYRFFDVDSIFIRFVSHTLINEDYKGFNISVRSIDYKSYREADPIQPQEVPSTPEQLYTVYLGGSSPLEFPADEFKLILVDMVKEYLSDNNLEVTQPDSMTDLVQLTRLTSCIINWPSSDNCVAVTFGVFLPSIADTQALSELNEDQLDDMWMTYSSRDDFKLRLSALGLHSFVIPNDAAVMTLWLLVFGVVILAVALFGVTLWRCNCFSDYKGMRRLSETDSVISRKSTSLFPTPHQNLPPVYTETYWSDAETPPPNYSDAAVENDGIRNKGFVRDNDTMKFYSDEDIIMSLPDNKGKKGMSNVSRHDIYPV